MTIKCIPKPEIVDYTSAKSFRSICLTSTVLMSLEKLRGQYTTENALDRNLHHLTKNAHLSGKPELHFVVYRVESAPAHKIFALEVFIDIERAINKTSFDITKVTLEKYGVPDGFTVLFYENPYNFK